MPFGHPINLPGPILLLSSTEVGLGLYLTFFNNSPFSLFTNKEIFVPAPRTLRIADTTRILGITILALGSGYFAASYMPLEENQFVHCSVPIRLGLSGLIFTLLAAKGRKGMSEEGFWELLVLGVFDLLGAIAVGNQLGGRFNGKVPGWERWL